MKHDKSRKLTKQREPLTPEIVDRDDEGNDGDDPDPLAGTASNRSKATKLRAKARAGAVLTPEEAAWLGDYEAARERVGNDSMGASRGRRIHYTEEENESVGVGSSAVAEMASAGAMSREEGRRYDYLMTIGMTALERSNKAWEKMVETLLERNGQLEHAHVEMMHASAGEYMRRIKTEAAIEQMKTNIEAGEEKPDMLSQIVEMLAPMMIAKLGAAESPAAVAAGKG